MRSSRRANIADVAAASGVGVGTVSRVINGAANVRETTRLKVLAVVEQLGYQPSHLATSLAKGTARTVAIVVPHLTAPSVVQRLAGALTVLNAEGYETVVCSVDSPTQRDHFLDSLPRRHRTDGVIVVSLPLRANQVAAFRRAGVPLVTVDVSVRGVPHTVIDDVTGGRLATEHLLALGHTRIGFIGDRAQRNTAKSLGFTASERRLDGYRRALAAAGLPADASQEHASQEHASQEHASQEHAGQELIKVGPHGPAHAEAFTAELLGRSDPPTAIFAASDTQAMGVLAAADRLDISVPGQLSVIGFDDIALAALIGLSTVRQPLEESGAEGARRLCALLRGEQVKPLRQLLALTVVQRGSTTGPGRAAARPPVPADRQELPHPVGQVSERAGDRS